MVENDWFSLFERCYFKSDVSDQNCWHHLHHPLLICGLAVHHTGSFAPNVGATWVSRPFGEVWTLWSSPNFVFSLKQPFCQSQWPHWPHRHIDATTRLAGLSPLVCQFWIPVFPTGESTHETRAFRAGALFLIGNRKRSDHSNLLVMASELLQHV